MERQRLSKEFHPSSISFNHFPFAIFFFFFIHLHQAFDYSSSFVRSRNFRRHVFHSNESDRFFFLSENHKIIRLPRISLFSFPSGTRLSRDSVGSSCGRRMVRCAPPSLPPSLSPSARAIPLQLLCITVSVGYRRQTASAVHHVVNVRRFLSYLSSLSLPFLSRVSHSLSLSPLPSLVNALIRLACISSISVSSPLVCYSLFFSLLRRCFTIFHVFPPTVFAQTTSSNRLNLNFCFPAEQLHIEEERF